MLIRLPTDLAHIAIEQRKKLRLSQAEVADLVGLKQKTISAFENNPDGTQLATAFRILSALQLTLQAKEKNQDSADITDWNSEW